MACQSSPVEAGDNVIVCPGNSGVRANSRSVEVEKDGRNESLGHDHDFANFAHFLLCLVLLLACVGGI